MGEMFTAARKDLHAQFIFQQSNLLTDAGLGREQALRGRRDIQIVVCNFPDITQLL